MFLKKAPESNAARLDGGLESLQSQTIDWLRFPLAVAVVFIHSFGYPGEYDLAAIHADPFTAMGMYNLVRICFSHVLTHIAVPTFFLISGFLFFLKWQEWDKRTFVKKMKSRLHTLIIPYVCWNLIAIASVVVLKVGAFFVKGKPLSNISLFFEENGWLRMLWDCHVWAEDRINWIGAATPMTGPYNLPLWFLRDLIVVSILSPLVYWFVKRTRHYGLLLLALAYISGVWPDIHGLNVTAVFFFSTGAYFSIYGKNLVREFRKVCWLSYIGAVLFLLLTIWFDGRNTATGYLLYPFYIIMGVCAVVNLASRLIETGRTHVHPVLTQSTFFIYATHTILVLWFTSKVVYKVIGNESVVALTIGYFLTPMLATFVCVGLYVFLKRYFPCWARVLTGNR